MSASLNNYIGLTDSPRDKFGKLMSIPDSLVEPYARVYTELPMDTVAALESAAAQGGPQARDAKLRLAAAVVTRYHGAGTAKAELDAFRRTFSERSQPDDIPEIVVPGAAATALDLLRVARPGDSKSELRRLIRQGAVTINGVRTNDPAETVDLSTDAVIKSGARTWHRIVGDLGGFAGADQPGG